MNVSNHKPAFSKVVQSDERKAANKERFQISKAISDVSRANRASFVPNQPIAASIPQDRIIGGYTPAKVIKHNHHSMSRAYNAVSSPEQNIRKVKYSEADIIAAHKSVIEVNGIYKTMSERIESQGGKVSAFVDAPDTAHTIAVRKSDKGIAAFSFKHNAVNVQFVKGIANKTVDTPFISGFRNIAAAMADNGTARYHKPKTSFVKRGRFAKAVNFIGGEQKADVIITVAFKVHG